MLVFVDESGDVGIKVDAGSSRYFTVTLLVFEDHDEALAADERISRLKRDLGLPSHFEFHFTKLKASFRRAFLKAVAPYEFFYFTIVINKAKLYGEGFRVADSFYKYTCSLVFETAKPYLRDAIVTIDGSGSRRFKQELSTYLRRRVTGPKDEVKLIRKIKVQDSQNNHLLQMADIVCGAVARYHTQKADSSDYRRLILSPRDARSVLAKIESPGSILQGKRTIRYRFEQGPIPREFRT